MNENQYKLSQQLSISIRLTINYPYVKSVTLVLRNDSTGNVPRDHVNSLIII